jgi:hypothetical protein
MRDGCKIELVISDQQREDAGQSDCGDQIREEAGFTYAFQKGCRSAPENER